jgi:hypothetical protein
MLEIASHVRCARSQHVEVALSAPINSFVQAANDSIDSDFQDIANAEKSCYCDWATSLDLLPVSGRETKRNHVFLGVSISSTRFSNTPSEYPEELGVIYHAQVCTVHEQKHHEQISLPAKRTDSENQHGTLNWECIPMGFIRLRFITVLAASILSAISVGAHTVALKDGRLIQFQQYRTTENALLYVDDHGKEISIPLTSIDLDRTRELSAGDKPPLDLPGLSPPDRPQTNAENQSLGELARQRRPTEAQTTTKQVWTSDDFRSASEDEAPIAAKTQEGSASETLEKFRLLGKEELGTAVLRRGNAPNVDFPSRKDWEERVFEAKQTWLDQVDRMVAHKDSDKDSQNTEIRLAQGAQKNFERIAAEGVLQARAVNDPALKAHLQYQRQQEFCKQTTGDLLEKCLASLDQLKWQMQREGIW